MKNITFSDYYRMFRTRGWEYPLQYFFQSHLFDILRGTDTHFWVPPEDYKQHNTTANDSIHYVACPTIAIKKCLAAIQAHAGNDFRKYQFIDLGCGKGKTLLVYEEYAEGEQIYPAIGVELVEPLATTARDNARRCGNENSIKIITDSATNWAQYATSAHVIIFLYNPFGSKTLHEVIGKIGDKRCYIAYVDPEHTNILTEANWQCIFFEEGRYNNNKFRVFFNNAGQF